MEQKQLRSILKIISLQEGVPEETILSEIEASISEAYEHVIASGDEKKLALWREISPKGKPTVYEFIVYTSTRIQNTMDMRIV